MKLFDLEKSVQRVGETHDPRTTFFGYFTYISRVLLGPYDIHGTSVLVHPDSVRKILDPTAGKGARGQERGKEFTGVRLVPTRTSKAHNGTSAPIGPSDGPGSL